MHHWLLERVAGVDLPNFEWHSWCFAPRPLTARLNQETRVSWHPIKFDTVQHTPWDSETALIFSLRGRKSST